ncbi:hypothetical protein PUNSTDRAFT_119194 [Punctularia strigosozonata HHB-11173 SS5]|uniref:uncharacterized protein n=1 Tax=Punctularia strigosozonata (strain HHB-11173) TaxID=741275 RepID=UPI00044181AE|nr:uncharacterized protein PUNSTDRAFT_119194 [Punctularia strigosozonata HHB-11173 SS5]EIN12054.1 hypothetical protein PUNSTDRAFT_119194 [Punctularia strigosozonata HHB-11173 SS5]
MNLPLPVPDAGGPQPLPSLPPSPTTEVDLTKPDAWAEHDSSLRVPDRKGKARARDSSHDSSMEGGSEDGLSPGVEHYPPMTDEEAETRRVEETLRRWEEAERQRRRSAREGSVAVAQTSIVGDVARRASLLWSNSRKNRPPSTGVGAHAALPRSSQDSLPMTDLDVGLPTPQVHSPGVSPRPSTSSSRPKNPFVDNVTTASPFDDPPTQQSSAILEPSPDPDVVTDLERTPKSRSSTMPPPERPVLQATASYMDEPATAKPRPPPPQPFDIPPPRTPPPRVGTPHANRPPEPVSRPTVDAPPPEQPNDAEKTRWWTDWLCGCGPTHDTDDQAGRTNPFE